MCSDTRLYKSGVSRKERPRSTRDCSELLNAALMTFRKRTGGRTMQLDILLDLCLTYRRELPSTIHHQPTAALQRGGHFSGSGAHSGRSNRAVLDSGTPEGHANPQRARLHCHRRQPAHDGAGARPGGRASPGSKRYAALDAVRRNGKDLSGWLEYCAEGLRQTLENVWIRVQAFNLASSSRLLLRPRQARLLQLLRDHGSMRPSEIWAALDVSRHGVMDLLHPLLEAGLVEAVGGRKTGRYALCFSRPRG